nr:O-acetylserine sulfhydrylase B [Cupriavidus metallidurans CH34]
MVCNSIIESIGNTPLVHVRRLFGRADAEVFAKLELLNPAGSVKDRPARYIVEKGLTEGAIGPHSHVIESSSGNLAIALAMICGLKGLRFTAVVDPKISPTNLKILRCYGAGIEQVTAKDSQGGYLETRIERVRQMLREQRDAIWINQYANPLNWESHYYGEAAEILAHVAQPADVLVLGVTTSGTVHGIARRLRKAWPSMRVVGVDAVFPCCSANRRKRASCRALAPRRAGIAVPGRDRRSDPYRRLHRRHGAGACWRRRHLRGGSSGAVVAAIEQVLHATPVSHRPLRILTLFPDRGERYLDTVYDDAWLARIAARTAVPNLAALPTVASLIPAGVSA